MMSRANILITLLSSCGVKQPMNDIECGCYFRHTAKTDWIPVLSFRLLTDDRLFTT